MNSALVGTVERIEAPANSPRFTLRRGVRVVSHPFVSVVAISVVATFVAWIRLAPQVREILWAEDGRQFLQGALDHPLLTDLVTPYAGYLHSVPRVLAAITVAVAPPSLWAQVICLLSCMVTGIVAGLVFLVTAERIPDARIRLALASITVLAPLLPHEVLGNAANLHSILFWMLIWVLLGAAPNRLWTVVVTFATFAAAATEIQSLFLLPLALWRIRERRMWPVLGALICGDLFQVIATLTSPRHPVPGVHDSVISIVEGYLINSAETVWIPLQSVGRAVVAGGLWLAIASVLPFVAAAIIAWRRGGRQLRPVIVTLAVVGPFVYAVSVVITPASYLDYASLSAHALRDIWITRYGVVPQMLLLALLVLGIAHLSRRWLRRGFAVVCAVAILTAVVLQSPTTSRRWGGPLWPEQVANAQATCSRIDDPDYTVLLKETIGWSVRMTCTQVLGDETQTAGGPISPSR